MIGGLEFIETMHHLRGTPASTSRDAIIEAFTPYKSKKSLARRKEEVESIMKKFPTKVPVIIERYHKEKNLPLLEKSKFLVPQEITMSQFVSIIRSRTELQSHQTFYMLINNKSISSMSKTVIQVYDEYKEEDGFLYITYASQEVFGGD